MIIHCSGCAARLQLDETKLSGQSQTLRCPKCQTAINVPAPAAAASNGHTHAASNGHSTTHEASTGFSAARGEQVPSPAPLFEASDAEAARSHGETDAAAMNETANSSAAANADELARLLATLLQRGTSTLDQPRNASRLAWERRRALVCVGEAPPRGAVARALSKSDYQTFVAENLPQALERMREERMDVVVLDQDFDPIEQGAIYVTREVNNLRLNERRRLFFVRLHATSRTGDAHAAFINNVNLIVNAADIQNLPRALERALRDFNDLYSDFNRARNVAGI